MSRTEVGKIMSTWMVVEDEQDLYDMILAMYDMLGIGGVAFATGKDAMEWIENVDRGLDDDLPELALIDIRLPDEAIDGVHIASRIRKSKVLGDIAICLMTAFKFSPSDEQEIMKESGADLLLNKPLPRFHEMQKILQDLVDQRRVTEPIDKNSQPHT